MNLAMLIPVSKKSISAQDMVPPNWQFETATITMYIVMRIPLGAPATPNVECFLSVSHPGTSLRQARWRQLVRPAGQPAVGILEVTRFKKLEFVSVL